MKPFFLLVASFIFGANIYILSQINNQLNLTYMDEYFHYDQTKKYCDYEFNYWNDKLTTFPLL